MQGIIFNALGEFVEETAGLEAWNDVIEISKVESEGAYTSGASYPDEEILALATAVCDKLSIELHDGLRAFGKFLFRFLVERGPVQIKEYPDTQTMLKELDSVVHSEVRRVHPDAYTPFFEYVEADSKTGELMYRSDRRLCVVAEGLLQGAADYYGQNVAMQHSECVHHGAEDCRWQLQFS
jgi:hypothetical protein